MASDLVFKGYAVDSHKTWDEFKLIDIKPKPFEESDIDIAIEACGVCGSDLHTITGGWGDVSDNFPLVVGHEIAGVAKAVGSKVKSVKVGDRVGVGAQIWSCGECELCKNDNENYCPKQVDTYGAKYPDGTLAQGGYSTAIRAHEQFVFPIPDNIEFKHAGPLMCAGLTVYSPLVRNGCGPGAKVGIVGVGGLGHLAIQLAAGLGAEVTVFSHSADKEADAKKLGATNFVLTSKKGFAEPYAGKFEVVVSTADIADGIPLDDLFSTLKVGHSLISCGMPDSDLPSINAQTLAGNAARLGGTHIGCKTEALAMLKLCSEKNIRPLIQEYSMKGDLKKAVHSTKDNSTRYRNVLIMDISN